MGTFAALAISSLPALKSPAQKSGFICAFFAEKIHAKKRTAS
jgi:hypothetical protein